MSAGERAFGEKKPRPPAAHWSEEPAAGSAVGHRARPSAASAGVRVRGGESVCCGLVVLAAAVEAAGNGRWGAGGGGGPAWWGRDGAPRRTGRVECALQVADSGPFVRLSQE